MNADMFEVFRRLGEKGVQYLDETFRWREHDTHTPLFLQPREEDERDS